MNDFASMERWCAIPNTDDASLRAFVFDVVMELIVASPQDEATRDETLSSETESMAREEIIPVALRLLNDRHIGYRLLKMVDLAYRVALDPLSFADSDSRSQAATLLELGMQDGAAARMADSDFAGAASSSRVEMAVLASGERTVCTPVFVGNVNLLDVLSLPAGAVIRESMEPEIFAQIGSGTLGFGPFDGAVNSGS